ncbi:thioredoxin-disulfide reductase [Desulfonatronospira sp.]|uniref:thioredoxin-disulfide reductase n=1 Tax=Desulfonatronospira sp. TaxID=1962951 RepID=UPI0025C5A5E6|nr:thioredoxin-disulfide reductase [Desulfonatronospira sp.]
MKTYESVVIGGGPAGITAALYLLRAGIQMAWVEKLSPGGQVLLTEKIDNYPGFPDGIKGYELVDLFTAHLEGFEYDKLGDEVEEIRSLDNRFEIKLSEQTIMADSAIVTTGADWKKLDVPGESKFNGRGVSYCALCDGNFFKDQEVACIGGGDTALEESLYLTKLVKKVYLIHRRDAFRGSKIYQDKVLNNPKIEILYNTVVREFSGEKDLEGLKLENVQTGNESDLEVQGAFVFIGLVPAAPALPPLVETDRQGFIKTDTEMRTSLPGLFAAGDIRSKLCRQISTAVGEGATAAHNTQIYLEQTG